MTSLRRHLRLWVAAWLVFQVASLSALVPSDCCAAHRPVTGDAGCHEEPAAKVCPMRGADGAPCPMHQGGQADAHGTQDENCSLRPACGGPMATLATFLSHNVVLTALSAISPDLASGSAALPPHETLVRRFTPPEPPPPRA